MTMYPEADYSLYKFARTRHGFWFWFIHGMVLVFVGVLPFTDQFHWGLIPMSLAIELIYWIGNYRHRDRLRKMNEKGPNNKHRDDVLEEADPVRWKDGRPLMELYEWYAAIVDETWDRAKLMLKATPPEDYAKLVERHEQYLKRKEFDKFLRK